MMWSVLNAVISALHDLLDYTRNTDVATWGGYTVTLYSAAVSLLIFERVLAVFFAAISRFTEGGAKDND